jgi:hypothetical protein
MGVELEGVKVRGRIWIYQLSCLISGDADDVVAKEPK